MEVTERKIQQVEENLEGIMNLKQTMVRIDFSRCSDHVKMGEAFDPPRRIALSKKIMAT